MDNKIFEKLQQILDYAISKQADEAECIFIKNIKNKVSTRFSEVENITEACSQNFFVRMISKKRQTSVNFSEFLKYQELIDNAMQTLEFIPCDKFVGLEKKENIAKNLIADTSRCFVETSDLIEKAKKLEMKALSFENITNSEKCSTSSSIVEKYILASNGLKSYKKYGSNSAFINVIAEKTNDANLQKENSENHKIMEQDYSFKISRNEISNEDIEKIAEDAAKRAIKKLGSIKIESQKLPIVIDRRAAQEFIGHILEALNGSLIARNSSFFCNMLNKPVINENISIIDDPTFEEGISFCPFDDEGRKLEKLILIQDGILKNYLLDSYHARELNLSPNRGFNNGSSTSAQNTNIFVTSRNHLDLKTIEKKYAKFLYVTDFIGMGVNLISGNYSRGVSGILVKNGEYSCPVSEITISGNLLEMFHQMELLNDLTTEYEINTPSIFIENLNVSGF